MVGRNLLEELRGQHEVAAPTHQELDLLDARVTAAHLAASPCDLVIHCAGLVGGIQANLREPARFLVENLQMGVNLLQAARASRVPRLLNLGSSCMYPKDAANPLAEDSVLRGTLEPSNEGYALAKIAVDRLSEYISREEPALTYRTLVPCNLFGRWDCFDADKSHMVPAVIRKLHEAKECNSAEVEIWGDGRARREFMYAGDLAAFIAGALDEFERLPLRLNVGPGVDHSIDEYYQTIAEVVGYEGRFTHNLDRPVGMRQKLLDVRVMKSLGWQPATSLVDGIQKAYAFFLESELPS